MFPGDECGCGSRGRWRDVNTRNCRGEPTDEDGVRSSEVRPRSTILLMFRQCMAQQHDARLHLSLLRLSFAGDISEGQPGEHLRIHREVVRRGVLASQTSWPKPPPLLPSSSISQFLSRGASIAFVQDQLDFGTKYFVRVLVCECLKGWSYT